MIYSYEKLINFQDWVNFIVSQRSRQCKIQIYSFSFKQVIGKIPNIFAWELATFGSLWVSWVFNAEQETT